MSDEITQQVGETAPLARVQARTPSLADLTALLCGPRGHDHLHDLMVRDIAPLHQAALQGGFDLQPAERQPWQPLIGVLKHESDSRRLVPNIVSCRSLAPVHQEDLVVFKNGAEKPDGAKVKLPAGQNMGDVWIGELLLARSRPAGAAQMVQALDASPLWNRFQEAVNACVGKWFPRNESAFKVEKWVKQNMLDMLRAWIVNAWLGNDVVVRRRGAFIHFLPACMVYSAEVRKTEATWTILVQ